VRFETDEALVTSHGLLSNKGGNKDYFEAWGETDSGCLFWRVFNVAFFSTVLNNILRTHEIELSYVEVTTSIW